MISLPNLLRIFWQEGFFEEERKLSDVDEHLKEKGFNFSLSSLGVSLIRAVQGGLLIRKNRSGYWKYIQTRPFPSRPAQRTELFDKYDFHPAIKKVAFKQFQDGYFKESIQNALVEVIDQVKVKTGKPKKYNNNGKSYELDGEDLMNYVFGCENQVPLIKFNELNSSLDRAEQRGVTNIFKGIVGIRDKKAHLNFIQNDPLKTIEYLSLASLLLRLLDENAPIKKTRRKL